MTKSVRGDDRATMVMMTTFDHGETFDDAMAPPSMAQDDPRRRNLVLLGGLEMLFRRADRRAVRHADRRAARHADRRVARRADRRVEPRTVLTVKPFSFSPFPPTADARPRRMFSFSPFPPTADASLLLISSRAPC